MINDNINSEHSSPFCHCVSNISRKRETQNFHQVRDMLYYSPDDVNFAIFLLQNVWLTQKNNVSGCFWIFF